MDHAETRSEMDGGMEQTGAGEVVESTSLAFVGRWNQLISTTNWEKGRIIAAWRNALIEAGAPVAEYADEAWSRRVGNVTPQHVGRLRRVFQRFGESQVKFPGLYWSHFQAAIEWEDAEMWLEGAVHSQWSVSEMRGKRWETLGAVESLRPREEDVVTSEVDEDAGNTSDEVPEAMKSRMSSSALEGPTYEGPDFGEDGPPGDDFPVDEGFQGVVPVEEGGSVEPVAKVRPFANLPPMPDDLTDACEAFKLAILRHKTAGWKDVACETVMTALDALKILAVAPTDQ